VAQTQRAGGEEGKKLKTGPTEQKQDVYNLPKSSIVEGLPPEEGGWLTRPVKSRRGTPLGKDHNDRVRGMNKKV